MAGPANQKKKLHTGRHASAMKRARQTITKTRYNRTQKQAMKTAVKAVRVAVAAKDKKAAQQALITTVPLLDKIGRKGILPKERTARVVSRLTRAVSQLGA